MDKDVRKVIKLQMIAASNQLNKDREETSITFCNQIKENDKKLELTINRDALNQLG